MILWPDNDGPGRNHMRQVQDILQTLEPQPRTAWIEPKNLDLAEKEDVADLIEQGRVLEKADAEIAAELHRIMDQARRIGPLEKLDRRHEQILRGEYRSIPWPWRALSGLTRALLPGTVTLLAGTVGASKSLMLLQAVAYWLQQEQAVSLYELEGDQAGHLQRGLAQFAECADVTDPDWVVQNPLTLQGLREQHAAQLEQLVLSLDQRDPGGRNPGPARGLDRRTGQRRPADRVH